MKRLIAATCLVILAGCTDVSEDSQPSQNDSLVIVPIGPGTDTSVLSPPDTPAARDSTP